MRPSRDSSILKAIFQQFLFWRSFSIISQNAKFILVCCAGRIRYSVNIDIQESPGKLSQSSVFLFRHCTSLTLIGEPCLCHYSSLTGRLGNYHWQEKYNYNKIHIAKYFSLSLYVFSLLFFPLWIVYFSIFPTVASRQWFSAMLY